MTDPEGPVEVGLYGVTKRFGDMVAVDDVTIRSGAASSSRCSGRQAAARPPRCA